MIFNIQKDVLLNNLRMTEHVCAQRGVQPVLSNIYISTNGVDKLILKGTDLDLAIEVSVEAQVKKEGAITLPAKKLNEIISKLPDKEINFTLNEENNITKIVCGNSTFDLQGISATEFPVVVKDEFLEEDKDLLLIEIAPFIKAIKQTVFATAAYDTNNVLSGVFCSISGQSLEMAATDGNRLSRVIEKIENKDNKSLSVVIPCKALNEFIRFTSGVTKEKFALIVKNNQLIFKLEDRYLSSRILEGQYPKYQQLIPASVEKTAKIKREEFISALDRASSMANERTNIVKLIFEEDKLLLKADTPELGDCMDLIDVEYPYEELKIAFNYKYLIDSLRIMESEKVVIELNTSLSATVIKPDSEDDYLSLIMPVQIR